MSKVVIAYWNIRGLAQPVRMLLGYVGEDFEDRLYETGDAPTFDESCWLDIKESLGLDFPNLPYFIDGDIKITQSNAIMRYVARKHNMEGKTKIEKVRVDIMENQSMDFRGGFIRLCYGTPAEKFKEASEKYKSNVGAALERFNKFIEGRKFFASDELTFVDFIMYELLDHHRLFDAAILQPFDNLIAFMKRFAEEPKIAAFMSSSKCFKGPCNNKMAQWR